MAPAVLDVLAGEADALLATTPATVTLIRSGRLRALGVASARRAPSLPDVPTFEEAGYRGFEAATWNGIVAPAGTPYDIVTRLNLAIVQVAGSRDVRARLATQGADVIGDTPGEFAAYLRRETDKWAAVVKASGARID
jgi:tripartite-type tricarboxylate transporter receptor subunit TctC